MGVLEDKINGKLEEKRLLEKAKEDPEKLGEIIKQYVDKFIERKDLKALQMLFDFIEKNMENFSFMMEHSENQLKVIAMLEENLGGKPSD